MPHRRSSCLRKLFDSPEESVIEQAETLIAEAEARELRDSHRRRRLGKHFDS